MKNRKTQSVLLLAGAAAGAAAAASWFNRRRLTLVESAPEALVEPESAELPIGRSADLEIDGPLSRRLLPQDDTSGGTLRGEAVGVDAPLSESSLDDIWSSLPESSAGVLDGRYDAVSPEDLGATWLERATQMSDEMKPHGAQGAAPGLENSLVSEATLADSHFFEGDGEHAADDEEDEIDDDEEIRDSELDLVPHERR